METREKAVGTRMGRITQAGKWKASRRAPGARTILPGLHEPAQQRAVAGVAPACEVFTHIRVFYLGRVGEVQEQLAWGSAKVFLEMPLFVIPASH